MGAVVSRLLLPVAVALTLGLAAGFSFHQSTRGAGTGTFSTAYHRGMAAARRAADAVFQAIVRAEKAAASYISGLSAAGYDAVIRAAAEASRLIIVLIERVYGGAAAVAAKVRLEAANVPISVGDVSRVVNSTVDVIRGICSAITPVPSATTGHESAMKKQARASTTKVKDLLSAISSSGETLGVPVSKNLRVTIGVLAVVAELAQVITTNAETFRPAV